MNTSIRKLLKLALLFGIIYALIKVFLFPILISPQTQQFVESIGIFGYLIIIIYTVFSHVFAPVTGSPAVFLGITLYGPFIGFALLYIASLISGTINFWISRKYGRTWVIRFVGEKSMREIDEFMVVEGKKVLFISRIFGFSLFDFISYAAGLTSIGFKDYFIITSTASLIVNVIAALILKNLDLKSEFGMSVWLGTIIIAGIVFGAVIKLYLHKKKTPHS